MARRSDHSRKELAALVIQAARELVEQHGTTGVTMRGIAGAIGYAAGSIYNAVGDIDSVLAEVNAETMRGLAEVLEKVVEVEEAEPLESALAIAECYVAYVKMHARLWGALLEKPPRPGEPVAESYTAARARLITIVAQVIAPAFPELAERQKAVIALWSSLQGVASLTIGGNFQFISATIDARDIARSIVGRYITGIEPE